MRRNCQATRPLSERKVGLIKSGGSLPSQALAKSDLPMLNTPTQLWRPDSGRISQCSAAMRPWVGSAAFSLALTAASPTGEIHPNAYLLLTQFTRPQIER